MKNLINVAKELNDVMGLDPAIKTVGVKKEKLIELIIQAGEMIDWETDEISEETKKELSVLGIDVPGIEPAVVIEEAEEVDLVALVDKATKLKDLKPLVEKYDEFKSLRKRLAGMFDPVELKEEMMGLIDPDWVPEEEIPLPTEKKEPTETPKPVEKKPAAAPAPKKEKAPAPKKGSKGPGVIATIVECIEKAGKKGISKEEILEELIATFPDRAEKSMKATINVQVPNRITKEKFEVVSKDGRYFKK